MTARRVAITGVGPVSAIGIGRDDFFEALRNGRSGIGPVAAFSTHGLTSTRAAEVRDFDVTEYLETEKAYLDRASQLAFAAMSLALEDANLNLKNEDRSGIGLIFGSAAGCLETATLFFADFLEKGPRFVKPILFPHTYPNTTISLLAIEYGLDGYHLDFASGATSSASALVQAYDRIRTGRDRLVIAGGVEALSPLLYRGYERAGWLSPHDGGGPEGCAPFDAARNGLVLGEGAGILVLEDLERARDRGAHVYGEIAGAGLSGNGLAPAMRKACRERPGGGSGLDYVSAAANGSRAMDQAEEQALRDVLGDRARAVPVSSVKPLLGEVLGADGALRTIAALGAIATHWVPPTLNLRKPACDAAVNLVRDAGLERSIRRVLVNFADPGGNAASLLLENVGNQGPSCDPSKC